MQGKATLRHAGILVKDLGVEVTIYKSLGFTVVAREKLEVVKMVDDKGQMIELVEGNWHPHIAVDWYETPSGNYVEVVKDER